MRSESIRKLVRMGVLSALAVALVVFIRFPLLPAAPFLEYDPADIPILITAFLYGPGSGLVVTVVVSVIQGLTVSAQSGWVGILMHILSSGANCVTAGLIYRRNRTRKGAVIALITGALVSVVVMVGCNLVFTPIFLGQQLKTVVEMLVPVIIPFNLLKTGVNAIITYLVYKAISLFFEARDKKLENKRF